MNSIVTDDTTRRNGVPMTTRRFTLCFTLASAFLCTLGAGAWMVATELSATLRATSDAERAIAKAATDLPAYVLPTLTQEVDDLGRVIVATADKRLAAIQGDANRTSKEFLHVADGRLQSIQNQVDRTVKDSLTAANGLRADLHPVLANSAALVKNLNDSIDDNYSDAQALLQSSTVAATQTAQTMEYVRGAAPAYLATGQQIAEQFRLTTVQFTGVTTDIHRATTKFTTPLTTKQKIVEGFKLGGIMAARFF